MLQTTREQHEYHLTIINVRMQVYFPSRMKIEHAGTQLTSEATPLENNQFIFNQDVVLRDDGKEEYIQLVAHLLTDKGSMYIAGVIKLYPQEMIVSEGKTASLALEKCIDTSACCELKVGQVLTFQPQNKNLSFYKAKINRYGVSPKRDDLLDLQFTPTRKKQQINQQCQSSYQLRLNANTTSPFQVEGKNNFRRTGNQQRKKRFQASQDKQQKSQTFSWRRPPTVDMQRQKELQSQIYKEGYEKLKQKYRRQVDKSKQQLAKRLNVQKNENNLKLTAVRMKLKIENQQRQINQKNDKLREYQISNNNLIIKEKEYSSLKDQLNKKEQETNKLQQIINQLTTKNEQLTSKYEFQKSQQFNMIHSLEIQIENIQQKLVQKEKEIQTQTFRFNECRLQKQQEIQSLKLNIQHHKTTIELLQQNNNDLQKKLENERISNNFIYNKNNQTIATQSKQLEQLKSEKQQWTDIEEQLTARLSSLQSEQKLSSQEYKTIQTELNQLRSISIQFNQLKVEHSSVKSNLIEAEKQMAAIIQDHKNNIQQINSQHQQQIDHYQKINKQIDNRFKTLSNKVREMQRQLQLNRNQQEKNKKSLDNAQRQIEQLKEKQKIARQALKEKSSSTFGVQTEYYALKQKLKTIDQIYNLQADKLRTEEKNLREQLSRETKNSYELANKNYQIATALSQLQAQLQSAQERCKKEENSSKEKQLQVQNIIHQYEQQILTLQNQICSLKQQQNNLSARLNHQQTEALRREQKIQKYRKDIRIAEQLYDTLKQNHKNITNEYENLKHQHEQNFNKLQANQSKLQQLIRSNNEMSTQHKRINQTVLLLHQDLTRITQNYEITSRQLSQKEKDFQISQQTLHKEKENYVKLQSIFNSFKRETEKYRERLCQNIQNIIHTSANYSALYQLTNTQHSYTPTFKNQWTFPEIIHQLQTLGKQLKYIIAKQIENIKRIQYQKSGLHQQLTKRSHSENTLEQQIQELSMQFQSKIQQKDIELANLTDIIQQLKYRIVQKDYLEQELNVRIQELNFTVSSMKLDSEALVNQHNKKLAHQRKLNGDLTEKTEYQQLIISQLDQRCNSLQVMTEELQKEIAKHKQTIQKIQKSLSETIESKKMEQQTVKDLKKQRKQLSENLSKIELHLSTELQLSKSIKQQLKNEQQKTRGLNQFISNLMKQKQVTINSQIQKSETIICLEIQLLEAQKDVEQLKEQNSRLNKNNQTQKDINKKNGGEFKRMQQQLLLLKINNSKLQQQLKQKLIQATEREEQIKIASLKNEKLSQKQKTQIHRLQEDLQSKERAYLQLKQEAEQIQQKLNYELKNKNNALSKLSGQINDTQESLFIQKETIVNLTDQLETIKKQNENMQSIIKQIETTQNELNNEMKQKQQKLYEITAKIYKLQKIVENKQEQQNNIIQNLEAQYMEKYQTMCDQYQRKIDELNQTIAENKRNAEEKQKQINKLTNQLKTSESQQNRTRKYLQQKIKKVEEEKLAILSLKNEQIQKHINDSQNNYQKSKLQQAEINRLLNQLQKGRKNIHTLNQTLHQQNQKNKTTIKSYQTELQQLKKKQQTNKIFREDVKNYQWNTEREIRKIIQNFMRNFLQIRDNKTQKAIEIVRGVQTSILSILLQKISQK